MKLTKNNKVRAASVALLTGALTIPLALSADQTHAHHDVIKHHVQQVMSHPGPIMSNHHLTTTPHKAPTNSSAAQSNNNTPAATGHIWNLQNADIKSVIAEVAKETGKNFIIDPRVSGTVNLISTRPLPPNALYNVFLTMLQTYGFAAIQGKNSVRIVPDVSAPQYTSPVANGRHPGNGSAIVVRVIAVKNVSSTQLVPILRPLMPQWSTISAYSPTNFIVASGTAENLNRLVDIIHRIDVPSDNGVSVVPLKNASAKQVVKILKSLQSSAQTNGGSTAQVAAQADDRTDSVILSGSKIARLRASVIISQLDQPSSHGQGSTQVIFLHYLSAKKIAPILDKIAKGKAGGDDSSTSAATTSSTSTSNSSDDSKSDSNNLGNLTDVLPEIDDNAVIITAPKTMMDNLKNIIQQLDIRPLQVYVQAIIVELDSSSLQKLGFQWGTFYSDAGSESGQGNPSVSGDSSSSSPFSGGAGVGVLRNGHFAALAAAIKGLSGADILSEPTIMVQNNQKAQFSVGKTISVQQSQQGSVDSGVDQNGVPQTLSTFNQEDVGLKLTVTPQINQGDSVQLKIDQTNGSLQNPDNPTTTPVINKSVIKTSVLIDSGDILVLGGLMSNNMTTNTFSTPILGDIPIIGRLFTYKSHELEKKDLMVFLRPVIVRTPLDGTAITNKKYKMIRNLQQSWTYNAADKDDPSDRLLPPRDRNLQLPVPFSE